MKCHILIALSTVYPQVGKYVFLNHFVTFLSVYCFSITSLQLCCSISDGIYLFFFFKENVPPGRKRHLDDALFEFFRKEVVTDNYFSGI